MPLGDLIKDPETGKIKPAVLIGGAGIGIAGVFLLMSKGGSSSSGGVVSPGQSGDNTEAIKQLSDAVLGLAKGTAAPAPTPTTPTPTVITNPAPTVTHPTTTVVKQGSSSAVAKPATVHTGILPTVSAISKPVNSGLSSAPIVASHTTLGAVVASAGAAVAATKLSKPTVSSPKLTTTKAIAAKTAKPGFTGTHIGGGGPQEY